MKVIPHYKIQLARTFRKKATPSEVALWKHLRGQQLNGVHFRRQRPIGQFVADFCCEASRLIVEVDGGYHNTEEQRLMDTERAAYFTRLGYQVLRFANEEVIGEMDTVLDRICQVVQSDFPADAEK